jgi:predicted nucleic acid-binding protein
MGVEKYKISDEGLTMHLNILEVDVDSIKRAVELGARYGLLITDSIHLSTMDKNRAVIK